MTTVQYLNLSLHNWGNSALSDSWMIVCLPQDCTKIHTHNCLEHLLCFYRKLAFVGVFGKQLMMWCLLLFFLGKVKTLVCWPSVGWMVCGGHHSQTCKREHTRSSCVFTTSCVWSTQVPCCHCSAGSLFLNRNSHLFLDQFPRELQDVAVNLPVCMNPLFHTSCLSSETSGYLPLKTDVTHFRRKCFSFIYFIHISTKYVQSKGVFTVLFKIPCW